MILITGGWDSYTDLTSVEVFSPSGARLPCSVAPLPASRQDHTQDGAVACGGWDGNTATYTSCVTLTGEGWQESHQLQEKRDDHSSWRSPAGLLLMGGAYSYTSTEILSATDSSSTSSFTLEYDTW